MQLIFYSHNQGVRRLGRRALIRLAIGAVILLPSLFGLGYTLANRPLSLDSVALNAALQNSQHELATAHKDARLHLDALATRLGAMQARLARLDAIGTQVVLSSGLEPSEFDFSSQIGQGGPQTLASASLALPDFLQELDALGNRLNDQETQFQVLGDHALNLELFAETQPSDRPLDGGWISSRFGRRTDPFTGRLSNHTGVDFANHAGTPIMATATGLVSFAGKRSGYGNVVELDHGDGYSTLYGHNQTLLVKTGELVKKGSPLATLGSSGRSTGPHLHYEVLHNGRPVNPKNFLHAAR